MKTKTKSTTKTKAAKSNAPMSRQEFKDAISQMSRNELIQILCDIYYAHTQSEGCGDCDCGCSSSKPKTPKAKKPAKAAKR